MDTAPHRLIATGRSRRYNLPSAANETASLSGAVFWLPTSELLEELDHRLLIVGAQLPETVDDLARVATVGV